MNTTRPDGDPFDLQRFLEAQALVIDAVRAELARGRKASHWMWFVFPQIAGLGHSAMAQRYAIASLDEAQAYAAYPVLGARLRELTALLLGREGPQRARNLRHAGRPQIPFLVDAVRARRAG